MEATLSKVVGTMATLALLAVACGGGPAAAPTGTPAARQPTAAPAATRAPAATATPVVARGPRGAMAMAKPVDFGPMDLYGPGSSPGGPDNLHRSSIYSSFMSRNNQAQLTPGLAREFSVSSDGLQVRFKVRKDVKFQDGSPMTMKDITWTIQRAQAARLLPLAAQNLSHFETPDDETLILYYSKPNPPAFFDGMVTGVSGLAILPQGYWERVGQDEFNRRPLGTGPYRVVELKQSESMKLEAFAGFFAGAPQVKDITLRIIPEDTTRLAALRTGEVDIVEALSPLQIRDVETAPGLRVKKHANGKEITLYWNTGAEFVPGTSIPSPFRDVRVRRAFYHAIDRNAIIKNITKGIGLPVKGPWGDYVAGAAADQIQEYEYNPDKARKLLQEANFPFQIEFPVYSYIASAPAPEAVEAAAGYLQALGLKAKYTLIELARMQEKWRAKDAWPLTLIRSHYVSGDPYVMPGSYVYSKGTSSQYGASDFDALWEECAPIVDPNTRNACLKKVYVKAHEQALFLNLYVDVLLLGLSSRVDWSFPSPGEPGYLERVTWLKEP